MASVIEWIAGIKAVVKFMDWIKNRKKNKEETKDEMGEDKVRRDSTETE